MGAGRFFCLLAVLAAAPAAAEPSALEQAASVGPWTALSQSSGLDLRDAENRPISRAALAGELKAAARGEAREAESLGARAARAWAEFLERFAAPADALRGERAGRDTAAEVSAPAPRAPKVHAAGALARRVPPAMGARVSAPVFLPSPALDRAFSLPLRV